MSSILAKQRYPQDLCLPNVMAASEQEAAFDPRLKADKLYIIDFDRSHKLQLKPGVQGAVALPETVCQPPPGITRLDPYSWDVYCAGHLLLLYLEVRCFHISTSIYLDQAS